MPSYAFHACFISGKTLLHEAASLGCLQTFMIVINQVQNRCPKDRSGNTPLHDAVLFGHVETVKWIFKNVPESTGIINSNGKTPIDLAKANPYRHGNSQKIIEILSQYPNERSYTECIQAMLHAHNDKLE